MSAAIETIGQIGSNISLATCVESKRAASGAASGGSTCSTGSESASATPAAKDLAVHSCRRLAGQRVFGLLFGNEDPGGHEELRKDPVIGAVLGCIEPRRSDR